MKLALAVVAVAGIVWLTQRTFAFGRKSPLTMAEQKEKAFGKAVKGYRYTQQAKPWTLRVQRRAEQRRRA